jgi:NAD(P)-dependent dehydrogenase (short-subunit alcohol dehydrogenase family)
MSTKNPFGPKGWTPERLGDLSGKTYVITGANAGAGFQATRLLLAQNASVVMLNRSVARSTEAVSTLKSEFGSDAKVTFIKMDLAVLGSVREAADEVLQSVPKIDALICNAAVAQVAERELTVDGFESQLGINHYGHFLLCGLLIERLEGSEGRVVVVASEGHKLGLKTIKFGDLNWEQDYTANAAYSQSKLAQMMFAYELQNRLAAAHKPTGVYVCHPGSSNTSLINEKAGLLTRVAWKIMSATPLVQSAERGAYPEVMCATEDGLEQRAYYGPTGFMNFGGPVGQCKLEPFVYDERVIGQLWSISEEATSHQWVL